MDKRLDFTGINPDIRLDQILIDANANRPAMFAMLESYAVGTNPNYIVSGCVVTVGGTAPANTWSLTAGYIYLNNELIEVVSQSGTFNSSTQYLAFSKVITYNTKGDITYNDGITRQTWQENRGVITVKSSVLTTELNAINGDTLDDKIIEYIGEPTVTKKGVVELASSGEMIAGTALKFPDASLLIGTSLGGTPTSSLLTLSSLDVDIKTFYGLKRIQFSGNIAYSNSIIAAGSTLFTIPSTSWNPAPDQDIYGFLFIDIGGLGDNNWTALKVKYTTSRTIISLEDTPATVASTNPFHINVVY